MRISVVDVGSNTVRLAIADARDGAPLPVHTAKRRLRLSEEVDGDRRLRPRAVRRIVDAVAEACAEAERWGSDEPFVFATAIVRDAPNRDEILDAVEQGAGVRVRVLPGEVEAELTFLAARRWMGWRAGPLGVLDIGGGSLEVAFGRGRLPDFAVSLPLGARRLTREHLHDAEVPGEEELRALRRHVRHQLRDVAARIRWEGPITAAATSRTFTQLARLCGAPPGRHGPFVRRELYRDSLRGAVTDLASLPVARRAELPGISAPRAAQALAGALVGHTAMKLMGIRRLTICPWAIREGILLRRIEGDSAWWADPGAPTAPRVLRVAGQR
ncbi:MULTISPECIES: Ppx/GppA family phosphatase [unclassified Streptomyces]|uniref:Ppx/GppA phosphatase family protein n=1 Tax=unclassified Streptomyces TaxID=2593676 RepID=UPI000DBAD6AE|nr:MULTISPECIES: Ppx/GppA family phosphatase [unclassified Streptomyces]MYT75499.1 Ppx/GppA family phosphatase [Streptomyces sp. SID8367]RAJ86904.1 exopolyphosphatase/guanosine-5'-triphosphate,3'-diphosphate pyrophosphatase [Streptomyces sp. PsTaAH-137]